MDIETIYIQINVKLADLIRNTADELILNSTEILKVSSLIFCNSYNNLDKNDKVIIKRNIRFNFELFKSYSRKQDIKLVQVKHKLMLPSVTKSEIEKVSNDLEINFSELIRYAAFIYCNSIKTFLYNNYFNNYKSDAVEYRKLIGIENIDSDSKINIIKKIEGIKEIDLFRTININKKYIKKSEDGDELLNAKLEEVFSIY